MSIKKDIFDAVYTRLSTATFTFPTGTGSVTYTPQVIKGIGNYNTTKFDIMYGEGDSRLIEDNLWETDLIIFALFDAGENMGQVDALLSLEEMVLSLMLRDPSKSLGGVCSHIYCSSIDMILNADDQVTIKGKRFVFKITYINPI